MVTIGTTQNNKYTIEAIYNDSKIIKYCKKEKLHYYFSKWKKSHTYI